METETNQYENSKNAQLSLLPFVNNFEILPLQK